MKKYGKHLRGKMGIHVHGTLNVAIFKEGKSYIAYAPALDLVAQGTSVKNARKNFEEVFDIYLEETLTRGTLEKDLLHSGWSKHAGIIQPPAMSRFSVPQRIGKDIELTALAIIPLDDRRVCPA
jgi:predicted RNase H-like HicB family nuclease